jgi:hypothetical protein
MAISGNATKAKPPGCIMGALSILRNVDTSIVLAFCLLLDEAIKNPMPVSRAAAPNKYGTV